MSTKSTKIVNLYAKSFYQNICSNLNQERSRPVPLVKGEYRDICLPPKQEEKILSTLSLVSHELHILRSVFLYSKKFLDFYSSPINSTDKLKMLLTIFPNLSETMISFLQILAKNNHLALLPEICDEYHRILDRFKQKTQIKVILASIFQKRNAKLFLKKNQRTDKFERSSSFCFV